MKLTNHQLEATAMRMLSVGLRSTIVESVTNLPRKRILAIRQELKIDTAAGGQLPGTHGICSSAERLAEATLFIKLYLPVAESPLDEVDIEGLITAHEQYAVIHSELRLGHPNPKMMLTMDECYVLARDYRQCTIKLEFCGACRIEYITGDVLVTRRAFCACPICSLSGREGRRKPAQSCGDTNTKRPIHDDADFEPVEFVMPREEETDAANSDTAPMHAVG